MIEKDLNEVINIERTVFTHPWTKNYFRLIISDMNNYMISLKQKKSIIGYGGYHLLKSNTNFLSTKKEYNRIVHLINIAIDPFYQKRGCGTYLMNTLVNNARSKHGDYCYLEARPSNSRALSFYKKFNFTIIGIIENYYPYEKEDALVFGREL